MAIHLPGFLNWGDISLVAALSNTNVTFVRPLTMSGRILEGVAVEKWDKEFVNIGKICKTKGRTVFK